ncbi:MAG: type I-C CRISPR-associated protein Cas8c/Csd1 [Eubacteriales bacterium]|nr:type I-C CRISPR-associated protein Cas8c/Csd1 [Eubacteriales bacterium]
MNWEGELLALYEKNRAEVGVIKTNPYGVPYVLLPPFHTTVTAQIEVTVSTAGDFLEAIRVPVEERLTMIPVTEKSGSRTAGKEPHPLCDNLQYLAADYGDYIAGAASCYELYRRALEMWHLSPYTHPKVDAIYTYLEKRRLMADLIRTRVLVCNEAGQLDPNAKIQKLPQAKAFVRFRVREESSTALSHEECWRDRSLQEAFVSYYRSGQTKEDLDYVTGQYEPPSYLHAKGIRYDGDGAKLISSNDETYFTFRGRFAKKEQAFSVGSETSQKIHNAAKWIVRRQGHIYDTLTTVTWESDLQQMPAWEADTEAVITGRRESAEAAAVLGIGDEEPLEDTFAEDYEEKQEAAGETDIGVVTAGQLFSAMEGYRKRIKNTSRMVFMAFDAATTGRLCLSEYKTLETTRYLDNIQKWHERCGWYQMKYSKQRLISYIGVPGIRDIANLLYGTDSGKTDFMTIPDKNGKKLYAQIGKRLRPCIWDGQPIPKDLVNLAVTRASNPQIYEKRYHWEQVLTLACSFVKKQRYEQRLEEWNMALDRNCSDRSYLYGRLLAVADRIEYRTFDKENDGGRETNAKRYMSTFSQRPFTTWKVIEEDLQPYLSKLAVAERRSYENQLDNICQLFDTESFQKNERLDGLYLLGFHSQSYELKKMQKETEEKK